MKPLFLCFSENLDYALGWMVIHSLWQATAIAFIYGVIQLILRKKTAKIRYTIANMALFGVVLSAIVTFCLYYDFAKEPSQMVFIPSDDTVINAVQSPVIEATSDTANPLSINGFKDYFNHNIPLIVTIWILGVALFLLKLLGGISYIYYLKNRMNFPADEYWADMLQRLSEKAGLKKGIEIVESAMVRTPMVVGHLKPMILFPMGVINRLTPQEVEAILAHELAHVMRNDFIFNILQSVAEALFYFHPAVWWLSAQIRNERESACDEKAIELINSKLNYAKALVTIQEMAYYPLSPALAFAGQRKNQFVLRMQRILNQPYKTNVMEKIIATVLVVVAIAGLTIGQNQITKPETSTTTESSTTTTTTTQYPNDTTNDNIVTIGDTLKDPLYLAIPPTPEIIALQKEAAEMEAAFPQFEKEKLAEIERLNQEVADMEKGVDGFQSGKEAEIAKIEKEIEAIKGDIPKMEKETDAKIEKITQTIKTKEVALEDFIKKIDAENKDIEAKIAEKKKERDGKTTVKRSSVDGDIQGLYGEIQGNMGEIAGKRGEIQGLYGEINGLRGEMNGNRGELAGKYGEIQGLRGEMQGRRGEMQGLRGEMQGLRGEIMGKKGEIMGKRGEIQGKYSELLFNTLVDDLKNDKLISTDKRLFLRLNQKEMFIDDVKQSDAIHAKYKAKYLKNGHRGFELYKRNGSLNLSVDDEN